jgi:hypothetical protein
MPRLEGILMDQWPLVRNLFRNLGTDGERLKTLVFRLTQFPPKLALGSMDCM